MKALVAAILFASISLIARADDTRDPNNYVMGDQGGPSASEYFNRPEAWYKGNSGGYTSAAQAQADLEARQCFDTEGGTGGHYCDYQARPGSRGARVDRRQADPNWQTMRACGATFASLRAATYSCPSVAQLHNVRGAYLCDCRDLLLNQ